MTFRPNPSDELRIGEAIYRVAEHPAAPGLAYGQAGRRGTVFQLIDDKDQPWALKVFRRRFREPRLVGQAERIAPYAALPGLRACERVVLTASAHESLLRRYPDLTYAVLMPWVEGRTWMEIVSLDEPWAPDDALQAGRSLAKVLLSMEENGLAHCDLSGTNVILPPEGGMELVDLEELYGAGLVRPEVLPGGSPGYAHRTAPEGLWDAKADRFAGAVLICEMLSWCDERVRRTSWGESYFDPQEMQKDSAQFQLLTESLRANYGEQVRALLEVCWWSDTLSQCPTFSEWLVALPESAPKCIGPAERQYERGGQALEMPGGVPKGGHGLIPKERPASDQDEVSSLAWVCPNCGQEIDHHYEICPFCERGSTNESINPILVEALDHVPQHASSASEHRGKPIPQRLMLAMMGIFIVAAVASGLAWILRNIEAGAPEGTATAVTSSPPVTINAMEPDETPSFIPATVQNESTPTRTPIVLEPTTTPFPAPLAQYEEGGILFEDDFESIPVIDWWSSQFESCVLVSRDASGVARLLNDCSQLRLGPYRWSDYRLEFDARPYGGSDWALSVIVRVASYSATPGLRGYEFKFLPNTLAIYQHYLPGDQVNHYQTVILDVLSGGNLAFDDWTHLAIDAFASEFRVYVNDSLVYYFSDDATENGLIMFQSHGRVKIDNIEVVELKPK